MRPVPSPQGGFSLLEILVALLLLTIVLSGTMAMQVTVLRTSSDSRTTSSAMILAQGRLEEFRSKAFSSLGAIAGEHACFAFDLTPLNSCTAGAYFFDRQTDVTVPGAGRYQATVGVSWITTAGTQQITMTLERVP